MAENTRPPVAIRIVRPFESEDALLESELDTIGKTSVVLIGAHPRPTGVILRFEVTLTTGATVLRGEGRVLAHKENAFRGQPGLTLRFTRLDPKSKAIVDRATAIREARGGTASITTEAAPEARAASGTSPIAQALSAPTPAPGPVAGAAEQEAVVASARASAREKANAMARENAKRRSRPPGLTPPPAPIAEASRERPGHESQAHEPPPQDVDIESAAEDPPTLVSEPPQAIAQEQRASAPLPGFQEMRGDGDRDGDVPAPEPTPVTSIPGVVAEKPRANPLRPVVAAHALLAAPPDREALLARLRERADRLPLERVAAILEEGAAR